MKKELLFAAVIMMMAAVSCGKENQNISGTDQMTSKLLLTATFESELTKTMLGEPSQGMIPVLWGGRMR